MSHNLERLRVLIVLNYYFPYISGVSEYARSLAEALAPNHDVTVLTGQHDKTLPTREVIDGYTLVRAPILFRLNKGYISPAFVGMFRKLQAKADVVNLHLPMLEAAILARATQNPLVITYQCDMAYEGGLISRAAVWGVRRSCASALRRSDTIATLSLDYASSSKFLKPHKEKISEVWPPNRFEARARLALETLSTKPPGSDLPIRIGFVGRFVAEKGIDVLLEALEHLNDLDVKLLLIGDFQSVAGGSTYDEIKALVESLGDKVEVLGKLDDDELEEFYKGIDILALPSVNRFEAFGMVQIEAMGFGAIPVASDMPGVRTTVNTSSIGVLAERGDAKDLARALREAIDIRRKLSRVEVAETVLSLRDKKFGDEYEDLFRSCLQ